DVLEARAPVISSAGYAASTVGSYFYYSLGASHSPISFTASNLPPGLGLDPFHGTISGYPVTAGDYVVPVTASNAALTGTANITIHVTKEAAGILESAAQVTGTVGVPASISLYSTVSDSTYSADGLPPGLSLAPGKSTITGTPTTAGHYEVSVHVVTDGTETKSTLSIDIAGSPMAPPVIGAALSGFVGAGYIYPLYISNLPTRITAEGLPDGVILDPSTGVLTGTPKTSGLYAVTITATNASGSSTAVLNVTAIAPLVSVATTNANLYTALTGSTSLPISVSTDSYPFYPGHGYNPYYPLRVPYSPYLQPSVLAAVITVAGLPPGLIFNSATAEIEGRSTKAGDYPLAITATTPLSTTTTYTTLHVTDTPPAPAASGALRISLAVYLNAFGAVGSPFQLNLPSIGLATDVACTGLPDGLILQKTAITSNGAPAITAAITGTPAKPGTYPVKFTFSNSAQTASGTVTIVVPDSPELPSFSGSLAASGVVGRSFSYYIGDGSGYATSSSVSLNNAASTGDGISMINVSGLPPGVQFNASSKSITGTPTVAGSYLVPISLMNAGGTTNASVLITIADQQPAVPQLLGSAASLGASTVSFAGEPIHLALNAASSTTNVTASGLPDGVTLGKTSDGSWTLSGTPATAGIYNLFLTATSEQGTETVPLTLNIRQLDQSIPAPTPDATPAPTPDAAPPTVVVSQQHVDTIDNQVAIRGRVLAYQPGYTVTVKAGAQSWQRLRVSPNGMFKLNLSNLPVGITRVTIRTTDAEGHVRTTHLQVHRHIA
ncbi:MAG TPA: putative Ig domain-containing protein, partial [Chthoniobacterales bacterium]